jgi:hypothetical protein
MRGLASEIRSGWKLVGVVVLSGCCLGWETAAHASKVYAASPPILTEVVAFPHTSTVAVVPVPALLSTEQRQAQELARLRTRTRRLEALVEVLRERELKAGSQEPKR